VNSVTDVPADPGTAPAFDAFYVERWPSLAALATAITRDPVAASDVAQEAMARVFARWGLLRDPCPWAVRVTRNLAVDVVRLRTREVASAQLPDAREEAVRDPALLDAVLALPERLRDVVLLHYLLDVPLREVAAVTRRPLGTVKRRLHEARALLAEELGDE